MRALLPQLPPLCGRPIRIESQPGLRDRDREVHAGAFLRERRIAFNCRSREFPRVFIHELFHFVWMRLSNNARRDYERILEDEIGEGAAGELGWSAEWRKLRLTPHDRAARTRRWREYCCESFCDTAAWLYSRTDKHEEFTLNRKYRHIRRRWFDSVPGKNGFSI